MHDRAKKERNHIKTTNNEHKSIITKNKTKKNYKNCQLYLAHVFTLWLSLIDQTKNFIFHVLKIETLLKHDWMLIHRNLNHHVGSYVT